MKTQFRIDQSSCTFCAGCASVCPVMAIIVNDADSRITEACIGCGKCERFCPIGAIARDGAHAQ